MDVNSNTNFYTLRTGTKQSIQLHREIVSEFHFLFSQHIKKKDSKLDNSLNYLEAEKSNYSTRLYQTISEKIPLYKQLENDLENPFKLFVMGPGNYGKSTLINSLLGGEQKYAKENIKPMTWKIDIFQKNLKDDEVIIIYKNGSSETTTYKKAEEIIDKEEEKTRQSKKEVRTRTKDIVKEKKLNPDEINDLKLKMERDHVYYSDIVEVRWGVSESEILNHFNIVDTPGLNQQNFSGEVKNSVQEYYHKSDGVIWLLDATAISAKNSNDLLKDLDESLEQMGGNKATEQMIAVLNRIDLIDNTASEREKIIKEAHKIYGHRFNKIIPYSALDAYRAYVSKDKELEVSSGRLKLINEIQNLFLDKAEEIQSMKKQESCFIYNESIKKEIAQYNEQLFNDATKYRDSMVSIMKDSTSEYEKVIKKFNNEMLSEYQKFFLGLESELEKAAKIKKKKQEEYLKKHVFKIDSLEKKFQHYIEKAQQIASEKAYQVIRETQFTQYNNLIKYKSLNFSPSKLEYHYTTQKVDVSMPNVLGTTAGGATIGFLINPIIGFTLMALGAWFSSGQREETKKNVTVSYQALLEDVNKNFQERIETIHKGMLNEILSHINDSYKNLFDFRTKHTDELINVSNYLLELCEVGIKEVSEYSNVNDSVNKELIFNNE